ncbi:unnamed protein product [Paramecium sonneborni]|uniref:Uncharacterized protein n=1 Tax=Paramecium sonneborni TaxID=65129 RepID=A0A8S1KC30_9CILI|nr:unnamed protein product [Paramecium sonneborni]
MTTIIQNWWQKFQKSKNTRSVAVNLFPNKTENLVNEIKFSEIKMLIIIQNLPHFYSKNQYKPYFFGISKKQPKIFLFSRILMKNYEFAQNIN